ncbi:MAG TPA: immunoglobulin domain-containing protein, partial [Candidatus Dormibacteraeota bacterium]|nr:immunoglobulin domain-containing protein [Candidatus Dormibacteraeota bacterium]
AQTYATNCTFSDGGAIGGTNGLGGDASFPGKVGRHGFSRGANIANSNGLFVIKNCIVAYPNPGTNAYGKFRDDGFNLSSDRSIKFAHNSGSKTNDPLLDVLHKNGGPVETLELLAGSPAIDAADTNFCLGTDARGVARPSGARCDIGAYEAGQRLVAPVITINPVDQSVQEHGLVTFRVTATGDPPLRYQWRKDDTELDGSTNATHTVTDATASDKGSYDVVVSNNSGSTTSEAATLTVLVPPSILQDPESTSVFVGESFTLTVSADGDAPLRYRWLTNGVPIPGAVLDQYTVVDAQVKDAGEYQVEVCNDVACVLSQIAQVDVIVMAPSIVTQPVDQFVVAGRPASFTVQAIGTLPLTYLWRKDSIQVLTETLTNTSSTLSIPNAQPFTNGLYDVIISNPSGSVTSAVAVLAAQTTGPAIVSQPVGAAVVECDAFA